MFTCGLLKKEIITSGQKKKVNIIIPSIKIIDTIKDRIVYNLPKKLPMIVPPKPYSKQKLGGYLLNDELTTNPLIKNHFLNKERTKIKNYNVIFDVVNRLSSIGYKINKDVLYFVLNHSNDYLKEEMVDINYIHPLLGKKKKLTKLEQKELDSFLTQKDLQENILGLANVFSDIPSFYIPVQLDFRGRFNCQVEYLNYQSNSLAKSLLLFSKSEKINKNNQKAISYLKLHGAICFGLDKLSAQKRLE
jgi:DNA-directed RNA polymerase